MVLAQNIILRYKRTFCAGSIMGLFFVIDADMPMTIIHDLEEQGFRFIRVDPFSKR